MTKVWTDAQAKKYIQTRTVKVELELELMDRLNDIDAQIIDARERGGAVIFFGRMPLWFRLLSPLLKLYWRLTS